MKIRLLTSATLAVFVSGCAASPVEPAVTVTATATVTAQPSETATVEPQSKVIEEVVEVQTLVIPDVVGENASDALDEVREFGYAEAVLQDATEEERIVLLRSNWYVCSMKPEPGTSLDTDKVLVLLAVKNSESCPGEAKNSQTTDTQAESTQTAKPSPSQTSQTLTTGQRNAVRKAESYLSFMAFSRTGLIDQLEFEGFSTSDSTFAVDYLDINWNKQAAEKAASYLDLMAFSKQGLIDQLLFEGFTQSQAEYGVSQNGY